jgi:hypothetical protein
MSATPNHETSDLPQNKRKREDYSPSPTEMIRRFLLFLRGFHWNREKPKITDFVTVLLTLAVALAAFWSAWIFQGQLGEAHRATELSEKQWKAQQRPWVGLSGNIEFPKQPTFQVFTSATPKNTAIEITTTFRIKNFGISPAFKTASEIQIEMRDNAMTLPEYRMKGACSLADQTSEGEGSVAFQNSVIFPSGEIAPSFETQTSEPIELTKIRRVWIAGCIAYQDGVSAIIHHTKFWIMSYMVPENTVPTIIERKTIYTRFSLPIAGWYIVKTEAD